ncbi:MAG: hypothetical protein L0G52_12360, partial [Brachybacterium sp.]|nr:hypothetical protein [Brachybacterium sp.]
MTIPLATAPALAETLDSDSTTSPQAEADEGDDGEVRDGEKPAEESPSTDSETAGSADGIVALPSQDDSRTGDRHEHCKSGPKPHLLRGNHKNCGNHKGDGGDDTSSSADPTPPESS